MKGNSCGKLSTLPTTRRLQSLSVGQEEAHAELGRAISQASPFICESYETELAC